MQRKWKERKHTFDFLMSILIGTPSSLKSFWILDRRNRSKKPGISLVLQKNAKVGGRDLTWGRKDRKKRQGSDLIRA